MRSRARTKGLNGAGCVDKRSAFLKAMPTGQPGQWCPQILPARGAWCRRPVWRQSSGASRLDSARGHLPINSQYHAAEWLHPPGSASDCRSSLSQLVSQSSHCFNPAQTLSDLSLRDGTHRTDVTMRLPGSLLRRRELLNNRLDIKWLYWISIL